MAKFNIGDIVELRREIDASSGPATLFSNPVTIRAGEMGTVQEAKYDYASGQYEYKVKMNYSINGQHAIISVGDDEVDTYFTLSMTATEAARKDSIPVPKGLQSWYKQVGRSIPNKS